MASLGDYGLGERELRLFRRRGVHVIYIIGDTDTGKTTLAGVVAEALAARFRTALVDLDAGQATIGPPTTLGWRMVSRTGGGAAEPDGLYFTGTTSPAGHLEQWVIGAATLVGEARRRATKVVIDACGLARGEAGRQLHHATVEVVGPDVIVAIERSGELGELVEPFLRAGRPLVVSAAVPAMARTRSRGARRSYRCAKFRAYFERAVPVQLRLDEVGVLRPRQDPVGRIASLRGADGRDVALGIVQKYDVPRGTVTVLSPLAAGTLVRAVVLGSMRIARDGRQLGWNV